MKQGGHGMSKTITPADLNMALDSMAEKKAAWAENHPDEKMPLCPYCNNIGLIRIICDEYGKEVPKGDKNGVYDYYEPCKCITATVNQTMKNNRKFATVPGLYADAIFENFKTDIYPKVTSKQLAVCAKNDAIKFVINFEKMEKAGMGLYIYSDARGSGKSRLASSISNELINIGVRNKYSSASAILSEIQRSWNDKGESEGKIIEHYISPRVLIIDDFGARSGQQWMDEKFLMIIDSRYQNNKVTIFTSNYDVRSLPFKDMRIIDRLSDVDRFHMIRMPDETVRPKSRVTANGDDLFLALTRKES
jgi:DNA replication protein DnaC